MRWPAHGDLINVFSGPSFRLIQPVRAPARPATGRLPSPWTPSSCKLSKALLGGIPGRDPLACQDYDDVLTLS